MTVSLPPEVVAAIDVALSDLERTSPGVSRDPSVRSDVEAAVRAALDSLERVVPEATEGETRQAMEAFESAEDPSDAASGRAMEAFESVATRRAIARASGRAMGAFESVATRRATARAIEELGRTAVEGNSRPEAS